MKDDTAPGRIDAYVRRGRRFAHEPVEWLRILYKQSELNWALGPTTPLMRGLRGRRNARPAKRWRRRSEGDELTVRIDRAWRHEYFASAKTCRFKLPNVS